MIAVADQGLRPASEVMAPDRIGSVWPTRLSFAQTAVRSLIRRCSGVRRTAFSLDDAGRGRASYRLEYDSGALTFHVFSYRLAPEEQEDRIIATKWDAVAYLRLGEPAAGELDTCESEIPKVIRGRAAPGTLVWTRANRSSRLVDAVVQSLAAGEQPRLAEIEAVGYLLRTTGFSANGRNGTVSFERLQQLGSIVSSPYGVQMVAAFLWREFSFDLVEHLAERSGGTHAVRLEASLKRRIGVGNSSGIGLAPFVVRHPKLVHGWILARESALADVVSGRSLDATGGPDRLRALLPGAARHFRARPAEADTHYAPGSTIADDLDAAARTLDRLPGSDHGESATIRALRGWSTASIGTESQEALNSLILEAFPETADRYEPLLTVDEDMRLAVDLTVEDLSRVLHEAFAWAWDEHLDSPGADHYFWYLSEENLEPRRRVRTARSSHAFELPLGFPARIREMAAMLGSLPPEWSAARFLAEHVDFRLLATWATTLCDYPYALPRVNMLAADFVPLDVMRFQLALYGMTSLTASSSGWVRGALHRGAPTAAELGQPGVAADDMIFPSPGRAT